MVLLIVTVVAVWLAQRLLAMRQAMRFRQQYSTLRRDGHDVAVGAAKRIGRRVFVALAADHDGVVCESLVFRGVTVFANGRGESRLDGVAVAALAAGHAPDGVNTLVANAAAQAAGFLMTAADKRSGAQTGTRPATRTHKVRVVPVAD